MTRVTRCMSAGTDISPIRLYKWLKCRSYRINSWPTIRFQEPGCSSRGYFRHLPRGVRIYPELNGYLSFCVSGRQKQPARFLKRDSIG